LHRDPAERDAFLRQACRDDSGLRHEVASLLAHHSADPRSDYWAAVPAFVSPDGRFLLGTAGRGGQSLTIDTTDPDHPKAGASEPLLNTFGLGAALRSHRMAAG
jgi:hypothetical protein